MVAKVVRAVVWMVSALVVTLPLGARSESLPATTVNDCYSSPCIMGCNPLKDQGDPSDTEFHFNVGGCLGTGTSNIEFELSRVIGNPAVLAANGLARAHAKLTLYYFNGATGEVSVKLNGTYIGSLKHALQEECYTLPPLFEETCVNVPRWTKQTFQVDLTEFNWPTPEHPAGRPEGTIDPATNVLSVTTAENGKVAVDWVNIKIECADPLILVHGWNGHASMWEGWSTYLTNTIGLPFSFQLDVGRSNTIMYNAQTIGMEMDKINNAYGVDHVSLIGYSKGGLDARRFAGIHKKTVGSVTTLATAHLGTPLTDYNVSTSNLVWWKKLLGQVNESLLRFGGAKNAGYGELSPLFLTERRARGEFSSKTKYLSIGGDWDGSTQATLPADGEVLGLLESRKLLLELTGDDGGDGIVPLESALGLPYGNKVPFPGDAGSHQASHVFLPRAQYVREVLIRGGGGFGSADAALAEVAPPSVVGITAGEAATSTVFKAHASRTSGSVPGVLSSGSLSQLEATAGVLLGVGHGRDSVYSGDSSRVACIVLVPDASTEVSIRLPGIGWVDSSAAAGDSSLAFGRGDMFNSHSVVVTGTCPTPGYVVYDVYRPNASPTDTAAFIAMTMAEGGAGGVSVATDVTELLQGTGLAVSMTGTLACSTCADTVWIVNPSGSVESITLRDDGNSPDSIAFDGISHGEVSALEEPGLIGLVGMRTCNSTLGAICRRIVAGTSVNVAVNASEETGSEGVLEGPTPFYEQLIGHIPIDMPDNGRVNIFATLSKDTVLIAEASLDTLLSAGSQVIQVRFSGRDIYDAGIDGPFSIQAFAERAIDSISVDVLIGDIITSAYTAAQFAHDPIRVNGPIQWWGIDSNANGLYDTLAVRVPLVTEVSGTYIAMAMLSDSLGNGMPSFSRYKGVVKSDTASVTLYWPGRSIGSSGSIGRLFVEDFYTHVPLYNSEVVVGQVDALGTLVGVNAEEFEGYVSPAMRAATVTSVAATCPAGDGYSLGVVLRMPVWFGASPRVADHDIYAVRTGTTDGSVTLWRSGAIGATSGDTLRVSSFDDADTTATLAWAAASGCGTTTWQCYVDGRAVGEPVAVQVRSVDSNGNASGAVDRFDATAARAAFGATSGGCWDVDGSGGLVNAADTTLVVDHLGHHIDRHYVWPMASVSYAPGDTVRIAWRGAPGDSANVTIRAIRGATSDTTLIVSNRPDSSTYVWTVPSTMRSASNYRIQVLHSAGQYQADYRHVGIVSSDSTISIRPMRVTNLTAESGRHSWTASWTEPGQNGGLEADAYDIRYSSNGTITESNFASMDSLGPVTPGPADAPHCVESLGSQASCHTFIFALKTRIGSVWSKLSNVASVTTKCSGSFEVLCEGGGLMAGGGGGGEEGARQVELASVPGIVGAEANSDENSLLWWAGDGVEVTDLQRLGMASAGAQAYRLNVREIERRRTQLDQFSVGVVDHLPTTHAIAGSRQVIVGTPGSVASVLVPAGSLAITREAPFLARSGEVLQIELGRSLTDRALVLETKRPLAGAKADSMGIRVERQLPDLSWATAAVIHPRRQFDKFAIPANGSQTMRVTFLGSYPIRSIEALEAIEVVTPTALTLSEAAHSRLGTVSPAVRDSGGTKTSLVPGDSLAFEFAATETPAGMVRSLFLTAKGSYERLDGEAAIDAPADRAVANEPILEFSLGAAYPNPSDGTVTIAYTLARQVSTVLRVYNVAGREVRTLIDQEQTAGRREAIWDGRDNGGRKVSSGVYFYRLQAGPWRSERKLIVLQK